MNQETQEHPITFFIVWSPTGPTNPMVRYCTAWGSEVAEAQARAQKAAEEMAQKYPGQEFYVMEAVCKSAVRTVQTSFFQGHIDESSDIPF